MSSSKKKQREPAIDPVWLAHLVPHLEKEFIQVGFSGIPVAVLRLHHLVPGDQPGVHMTPAEFLIMADLWPTWWSGDEHDTPSMAQIARHVGISERQVQRYLHRMEISGWVTIVPQHLSDGTQLPNRYDFSPFLKRLIDYLDEETMEVWHG